jgi:hypothetical protein
LKSDLPTLLDGVIALWVSNKDKQTAISAFNRVLKNNTNLEIASGSDASDIASDLKMLRQMLKTGEDIYDVQYRALKKKGLKKEPQANKKTLAGPIEPEKSRKSEKMEVESGQPNPTESFHKKSTKSKFIKRDLLSLNKQEIFELQNE